MEIDEVRKQAIRITDRFYKNLNITDMSQWDGLSIDIEATIRRFANNNTSIDIENNSIGGLTELEKKELELVWNKNTDYGNERMTYDKYLDAGLEIMTMAYLTGKNAK